MKKVLAVLVINPDYVQFAIPELKSLLRKLNLPFSELFSESQPLPPKDHLINHQNIKNFPFVTITVPNFAEHRHYFQQAARKAVLVSKFVLLISQGKNYQELIKNRDEQILKVQSRSWEDMVACDFQSRNRSITRQQQNKKIHSILKGMDIRGKIDIKKAEKRYQLIEDHRWYQDHHEVGSQATLENVYFGIQLSNYKEGKAKFNARYELSKRIYLGPTSADNDLAFMMCNQANIGSGSLVLDPFVGTGGLLIPPASMGAYTFGSDLDIRVINGYSVGRINKKSPYYDPEKKLEVFTPKIFLNFDQYGFIRPFIFRMDCINPSFRSFEFLDAIICDPPYGLRAMSRTVHRHGQQNEKKQTEQINQQDQLQNELDIAPSEKTETQPKAKFEITGTEHQEEEQQVEVVSELNQENQKQQQVLSFDEMQKQLKKKQKKIIRKQNKKKRNELLTEEERQYKADVVQKMTQQRVKRWQKFDKAKVETTEREKIFQGLLTVARRYLKVKGRLVFLYPVFEEEEFNGVGSLPPHESFVVIDMSINRLGKGNARVLVTLQKAVHSQQ